MRDNAIGGRLSSALLGAIFGAIYGLILAVGIGFFTDGEFRLKVVWVTSAVFATFGLLFGSLVGDLIGSLVHFILGLFSGMLSGQSLGTVDPEPREHGVLRGLFVFGFATGIAIYFAWRP